MSAQTWWFVARASGMVLWLVIAVGILWGLAISSRIGRRRVRPAWTLDLHRHLGALGLVFLLIHLVALWADSFVSFGWSELFVPMASAWRPGAVAWGIAAMYLFLVIEGSSLVARRVPRRLWYLLHLMSAPLAITATVHAIRAGTDWNEWTARAVVAGVGTTILIATVTRLASRRRAGISRTNRGRGGDPTVRSRSAEYVDSA